MKVRFLLDECESPRLKTALLRFNPAIDVLRVGEQLDGKTADWMEKASDEQYERKLKSESRN
jgi:hypothetical protein